MTLMQAISWKYDGKIKVPQDSVCLMSSYGVYETCISGKFNRFLDIGLSNLTYGQQCQG